MFLIQLGKVAEKIKHVITFVSGFTKPGQHRPCLAIYLPHLPNLMGAFLLVHLINADCINP
jgi:hypothetical protein